MERRIFYSVGTGASFGGNSLLAEIGLGQAEVIKSLEIQWPRTSGNNEVFENIAINQVVRIKEHSGLIEKLDLPKFEFTKGNGHHHYQM